MQEKLEKVCTVWTINVVFGQEHSRLGTLEDNFDGPDRTFSNHNIIWIREPKEWIKIAQIGTWFGFDFIWFGCEFIFNGVAMIAKTGLQQVMFTVSLSGRKKARKTGRKGHNAVSKRTIARIPEFFPKIIRYFWTFPACF